jgi:hypothetical protein
MEHTLLPSVGGGFIRWQTKYNQREIPAKMH